MSHKAFIVALCSFAALVFSAGAFAVESDQVIDPQAKAAVTDGGSTQAMDGIFSGSPAAGGAIISFLGFAVIIGGIGVVVWYLFKRGVIRKPFVKGEGKLNIAETRMLGNRQFIMVVEYEGQKILLGVGPGKIDYLTNLNSYRGEFAAVDANDAGGNAQ